MTKSPFRLVCRERFLFFKFFLMYYLFSSIGAYASELNMERERNINSAFFYIGSEMGVVQPVRKKFRYKESNTIFMLKKSKMYSAKVGYSFYPQMAIEFSATRHPKYQLHYILPEISISTDQIIPKTPGATSVTSNIYMLNLVYDLEKVNGLTPFVIIGGGIAHVKIKPTSSFLDINKSIEYFRLKKHSSNCLAWQIGLGFSQELGSNFSIDVAAKLQAAHSITIKYDTLNINTMSFIAAKPIKKTIGVGEFGIGFTYKLPI